MSSDAESTRLNRDSYDAITNEWDSARVQLSAAERILIDLTIEHIPCGASILDLGCGTGRPIAEYLVSRGFSITGVDQSEAMLQLARYRMPEQRWILSSLESFEPTGPTGQFAAVIAWDSLFHIPRSAHAAILSRARAAMPINGRLVITVGGSEHPAFTDSMFGRTFFYDSHPPEAAMELLGTLHFAVVHTEFLNLPTGGRDKGRFAIVAEAV